jgi:hypothetical protein
MQRHKIAQESIRPEYLRIAMGLVVNTKSKKLVEQRKYCICIIKTSLL